MMNSSQALALVKPGPLTQHTPSFPVVAQSIVDAAASRQPRAVDQREQTFKKLQGLGSVSIPATATPDALVPKPVNPRFGFAANKNLPGQLRQLSSVDPNTGFDFSSPMENPASKFKVEKRAAHQTSESKRNWKAHRSYQDPQIHKHSKFKHDQAPGQSEQKKGDKETTLVTSPADSGPERVKPGRIGGVIVMG
jgi:hypothetical protein